MRNTTKTSGSAIVKRQINAARYARLLASSLPAVIETEAENRRALAILDDLMRKGERRTPEETMLFRLLAHLVDAFERRYYQPGKLTPREMLRELMAMRRLKQADLAPVLGSKGVTSEIINGKRAISKAQAKALADFFHVSAEVFI